MQKMHINERGTHTTVIEAVKPILALFTKGDGLEPVQVSPGKIEGGAGSKSKSIKFKHINDELYEMVVISNGSRQEFKVFTRTAPEKLLEAIKSNKKTKEWNVNYTDMRDANKVQDPKDLDEKYFVKK